MSMSTEDAEHFFGNFMLVLDNSQAREFQWNMFSTIGYARVKSAVLANAISPALNRAIATEWLSEIEGERAAKVEAERREDTSRTIAAAERSAAASQKSARWAMWAAIISLATVAATVIPALFERLR